MSNKAMSWAIDAQIKGSHKLVLMLLADAHNGHTGACFPSQVWLQEHSGLADSTVAACLKDLEDWGLVSRRTTALGRGRGSRRDFELHLEVLTPRNVDLLNTGVRPLENEGLDPPESGGVLKEEPEREPELTGTARAVFDHYSKAASEMGWVKHAVLTPAIAKHVSARIKEYGEARVKQFITALKSQAWTYRGFPNSPEFRATLVYICRPRTFAEHFDKLVPADAPAAKILELHEGLSRETWYNAVQWFAETGQWDLDHVSPAPDRDGCKAPADLLASWCKK